ncbi:peptide ABC transporter permease [Actinoplanes italicus]|uniref:Peptide/nickel transport system permease protein n=1 Tax=Actinoplanes italicus TaxID=113567 RepID=A0A2T0KE37_9ACTN|nr:ABC transporter permease [Actinoplanes italicus]PRX21247.1 peptide/nickel transport system permease protein [Actinoplanes italicus]GIE36414.1 peptide ABC transporter permease [Actinoplanes italicus]
MSNTPATADSRSPGTEDTAVAVLQPETAAKAFVGRSPGELAWIRLKRDRTAFGSFITVVLFIVVALASPLISKLYGVTPTAGNAGLLNSEGLPIGYLGGISADHWLGLEAGSGRDLFMQLIFGLRTSLIIAFSAAIISISTGVVIGIISGYFGGWVDQALTWFTDFALAFPFLVFALAIIPIINTASYDVGEEVPGSFRIGVIIGVFALFGWMTTARLVRGQILSLREREYVEAARAAGASSAHILFKQLLPNIWAPILVAFSLALPGFIAAEAALSFLNIGVVEPTPDLGRLVYYGRQWLGTPDWAYFLIPASAVFIVVLAFNLLGDSLRDALDPKSSK